MSSKIQAVLFDLDGTLRHNRPDGFESFIEYMEELGHNFTLAQLRAGGQWQHRYWADSPDLRADIAELGADTGPFWTRHAERQIRALSVTGDVPTLAARINAMFDERYEPSDHVPDEVGPTLARLRADGYTLGLVSNRTDPLGPVAAELGLAGHFHFTLSAGEAQSWKPDPGIFRQAVALAGCAPAAAAYVGDNFYADVQGARGAGLHPILIDPKGLFHPPDCPVIHSLSELESALEQLGT